MDSPCYTEPGVTISTRAAEELVNIAVGSSFTIQRETLLEIVDKLVQANQKIYAIKIVRMVTAHGLLAAKTIVDLQEAMRKAKENEAKKRFYANEYRSYEPQEEGVRPKEF